METHPLLQALRDKTAAIGVVGLGYVGLPVAAAMGRKFRVIGFDVNETRIDALRQGVDHTREVSPEELAGADILFTADPRALREASFIIIAVPTPVNEFKQPDLRMVESACRLVGRHLRDRAVVVLESTVYPGVTEEFCAPIIEQESGRKCGEGFFMGYSPERINPGDREHTFTRITKVVSGQDAETLEIVASVYGEVVEAGVHRAPTIKTAEAAKVIENTQRDLNIALMNELSLIFHRLGVDTLSVLEAARTKWNFLPFTPGLVGGHCIGVDPYYLTFKAEAAGYHPQVILAGRRVNDGMGAYVAQQIVKELVKLETIGDGQPVTVLGLAFKENVPDIRNTKVVDIVRELESFGLKVKVHDPLADAEEVRRRYGLELSEWSALGESAAVVLCVAHEAYRSLQPDDVRRLVSRPGLVADLKGLFAPEDFADEELRYWRL